MTPPSLTSPSLVYPSVEGALKEVKRALLDADVNLKVTNQLVGAVKAKAVGMKLVDGELRWETGERGWGELERWSARGGRETNGGGGVTGEQGIFPSVFFLHFSVYVSLTFVPLQSCSWPLLLIVVFAWFS